MDQSEIDARFIECTTDPAKAQLAATVRNVLKAAAAGINATVPEGREKILAIAKLEEAMYWAVTGIDRRIETQPEGA